MPQHRKRRRERETDVMEDRSTTTSATTTLQGGNENHGNDSETQGMAIGPTTSVTSTLQGGIQVGNHNNISYRNCAITYNINNITVNCQQRHPAEDHVVSEDTPPDLIPSSSVHTTTSVRVVDCEGRELELGDVVMADLKCAIYTGDGMIIGVNEETRKIVHEPINVEEPFRSSPSLRWGPMYSPIQIVQRAKGKVGQKYDYGQVDFVYWCCKYITQKELLVLRGRLSIRDIKLLNTSGMPLTYKFRP